MQLLRKVFHMVLCIQLKPVNLRFHDGTGAVDESRSDLSRRKLACVELKFLIARALSSRGQVTQFFADHFHKLLMLFFDEPCIMFSFDAFHFHNVKLIFFSYHYGCKMFLVHGVTQ
ncbi:hypothetical protein Dsin_031931 [Dipteronia sinensis]|uniref:Uncharacterized protein n=1 Tax=Dipteronia sinensis TaxID=43782 RepID=A0AAD9ZMI0_9ROSI|nr:hypothetical protein Dsin_031931 [Dipteronia sinensis]